MRVTAASLLTAIPMAAFVEADAFVSPSSSYVKTKTLAPKRGAANMPLSTAASCAQQRIAPWSTSALEMSGGEGEAVSTDGTATIPDEVFNLVKSIVGAGVLSLPAGEHHWTYFYSLHCRDISP